MIWILNSCTHASLSQMQKQQLFGDLIYHFGPTKSVNVHFVVDGISQAIGIWIAKTKAWCTGKRGGPQQGTTMIPHMNNQKRQMMFWIYTTDLNGKGWNIQWLKVLVWGQFV